MSGSDTSSDASSDAGSDSGGGSGGDSGNDAAAPAADASASDRDGYVRDTFGADPTGYGASSAGADDASSADSSQPAGDGTGGDDDDDGGGEAGTGDDDGPADDGDGGDGDDVGQSDDDTGDDDTGDDDASGDDGGDSDDAGQSEDDTGDDDSGDDDTGDDDASSDDDGEDGDDDSQSDDDTGDDDSSGDDDGEDGDDASQSDDDTGDDDTSGDDDGEDGDDAGQSDDDSGNDDAQTQDDADADSEPAMGRGGDGAKPGGDQSAINRPDLGSAQREHAAEVMSKMSPEDHDKVTKTLAQCKTAEEVDYTAKALAAGHTPDEIAAFQKEIAGKDKAWMDANLHMAGASSGQGVKQQWSFSCQATEAEAMKGELDPMYALQMHKDNPKLSQADDADGNRMNPNLANDQAGMLQSVGGNPTPRNDTTGAGQGGKMAGLLNQQASGTGVSFDRQEVGNDPAEMSKGLDTAQQALRSGLPVPVMVTSPDGSTAHASMMTSVDDGPPRRYGIHDPWTGSTSVYSEDDIKQGKLGMGNCTKLQTIYPPTQH